MKFTLYQEIITRIGKPITWVEAGEYPVVRMFDGKRVMIDVSTNAVRQLTVVPMYKGQLNIL